MSSGSALASHRRQMGLSQEALAEKLSVSRQTIAMWETEKQFPSEPVARLAARFFGLDEEEMLKQVRWDKFHQRVPQLEAQHQVKILTETELAEARKIQNGMLPRSRPEIPGIQIATYFAPASAVGGDFYDFISLGQDRWGVVVGDAVGHGIGAALLMTMTLTDFRSIALREPTPGAVLNAVNRRLAQRLKSRTFVASTYLALDAASQRLSCAIGGMQPLLIGAKTGRCVPIEPPGARFPLGVSGKSSYNSCDVPLGPDDVLVLFTDGIPEALNVDAEPFSFERLEGVLLANRHFDAPDILQAVLTEVHEFIGERPPADDITLLVLKATESFAPAPVSRAGAFIAGQQKSVSVLFAVRDGVLPAALADSVRTLVRDHGGVVDAIGDEMLVTLFGVPQLREDDADRAIAAALAIQELKTEGNFRIGVNTGTATVRADAELDYRQMGVAISDALSLANAAQPGHILVGEKTYHLTRNVFQFESERHVHPPFADEPLLAYPVLAATDLLRTHPPLGLRASLIGREREMEQLNTRLNDLLDGRGGVVSITGEAGIGKSRLVEEFRALAGDRVQWLDGRCVSYGQAMSYSPFRGIIGGYLGILPTDTADQMKAKLEKRVNALLPGGHKWHPIYVGQVFFPQYEAVLRTASGDDYAKQYTYSIMRNLFEKIAEAKPLVLTFEDLHWADPSSLALLEFLMENVDDAPILYLWVYRPERNSGCWRLRQRAEVEFSYCNTQIDLSPLRADETETLVNELLWSADVPSRLRALVGEKAAGNPLYIEEILRSIIEVEGSETQQAIVGSRASTQSTFVPSDTLQSVILARVDRLPAEAKETLQIGSVVGDSFALPLLEGVIASPTHLPPSLQTLERAEMLQRRRVGDEWEYRFRHPLIHDVVYHSLLPEDRATLHERTGTAIESLYPDQLDTHIDALAYHFGRSGNLDKGLAYLTLAGDKAAELKSYWEALDYYGQAMKKAEGLDDERRKKAIITDLVLKRSGARHMLGALRPDVEELERYVKWAEKLDNREKTKTFYLRIVGHCYWSGEGISKVYQYFEKWWAYLTDDEKIDFEQIYGRRLKRFEYYRHRIKGDYEAAVPLIQQVLASFKNIDVRFFNVIAELSQVYREMGQWKDSLAICQKMLRLATERQDSTRIMHAHSEFGKLYLSIGEWEKTISECESALDMSPSGQWMPLIVTPLGTAYCKAGQLDEGINLLKHWKSYAKRVGRGVLIECEYCLPLAEGYLVKGEVDKARTNADEALQIAKEQGYPLHEAQAYRILGEIHAPTDFPTAEKYFAKSLGIMQRIKARNEGGKTELSWGRACKEHGDVEGARKHLTCAAEIFEALGTIRYLQWTREDLAKLS